MNPDDELRLNPKAGKQVRTGNERFAILRIQKLKTGNFINSVRHSLRAIETPNADKELQSKNADSVKSVDEYRNKLDKRLATVKRTIRKDATVVVEYLVTASPEVVAKMAKNGNAVNDYFAEAMAWIDRKHGKENILGFGVHRDEGTPHMYCYVTPITKDGRLSAKDFFGSRQALSEMQTEFVERVGERHGLERGVKGSRARHKTIRQFYTEIERTAKMYSDIRQNSPFVKLEQNRRLEVEKLLSRIVAGDTDLLKDLQRKEREKTRDRGREMGD